MITKRFSISFRFIEYRRWSIIIARKLRYDVAFATVYRVQDVSSYRFKTMKTGMKYIRSFSNRAHASHNCSNLFNFIRKWNFILILSFSTVVFGCAKLLRSKTWILRNLYPRGWERVFYDCHRSTPIQLFAKKYIRNSRRIEQHIGVPVIKFSI